LKVQQRVGMAFLKMPQNLAVTRVVALLRIQAPHPGRRAYDRRRDHRSSARSRRPHRDGRCCRPGAYRARRDPGRRDPGTCASTSRSGPPSWSTTPACRGPRPSGRPRGSRRPWPGTAATCGPAYGQRSRNTPALLTALSDKPRQVDALPFGVAKVAVLPGRRVVRHQGVRRGRMR